MPSHHSSPYFQPPPPIRTATSGSQKSVSSGHASPDTLSPTTTFAHGTRSPTSPASPAEESFFGAITSRIRGRSHSRNRENASHKRSKSPMTMPPEQLPSTPSAQPVTPRSQQPRHKATASQSSTSSTVTKPARPGMPNPARRSTSSSNGSDMWRGRHSNSWLFNDFSVTESVRDIVHMGRKS
jgi:hypothetical protein